MESFNLCLMSEINRKFSNEFSEKVKNQIKDNLAKFYHHTFESDDEFFAFAKERLTRIEDVEEKRCFFFLDYRDDENRGLMVLSYSTKTEFIWNEDHTQITATFGC